MVRNGIQVFKVIYDLMLLRYLRDLTERLVCCDPSGGGVPGDGMYGSSAGIQFAADEH
jgi:hypothetical protein